MAGDRSAAPGGGVVVRCQRDECACGDRAGSGSGAGARSGDLIRRCPRWWCRVRRRRGWRRRRRCWPSGWRALGRRWRLADVAHTLNHHRARQAKFGTVVARDRAQAVAGLRALGAGEPAAGVVGCAEGPVGPGTVFVYSGRGSQWAGMGRQLLGDEPAFAAAVAELEPVFVATGRVFAARHDQPPAESWSASNRSSWV